MSFQHKHILGIEQMTKEDIAVIFDDELSPVEVRLVKP